MQLKFEHAQQKMEENHQKKIEQMKNKYHFMEENIL